MAVTQTRAASYIQEHTEEISSHQIISLLMDGAIERIDQALEAHRTGRLDELDILVQKLIAIINGLRNSLNFDAGGDIAANLDALYDYMIGAITESSQENLPQALTQTKSLLSEVKLGWDQIAEYEVMTPA